MTDRTASLPLAVKLTFTAVVLAWAAATWRGYGAQNFLWFCDIANFLIAVSLWLESPLLLSSQAVSVLFVQVVWLVDVVTRAVFGFHPVGGTEYMFDSSLPLSLRMTSLFHLLVPALLIWALLRLGYDRRGWLLQTVIAWLVLPVTYALTDPALNINWVSAPFGRDTQEVLAPAAYLLTLMAAYPIVLYLPSHLILSRVLAPRS